MTTTTAVNPYAALNATSSLTQTANEAGSADRFLKLLVTQMQNQDPLNPMDNAQITSQMAQINTVEGISTLNTTVKGLNGQFAQLQALSGAALVGHDITVAGNKLDVQDGTGVGGFELASTADTVKVDVLNGAGRVVKTIDMGAESAGRHSFEYDASATTDGAAGYTFRVTAKTGTTAVATTALMRDHVLAVSAGASGLVLQTQNSGDIAYSDVKAFN
jgi:flagellar basal-body rod modification protein FlgD